MRLPLEIEKKVGITSYSMSHAGSKPEYETGSQSVKCCLNVPEIILCTHLTRQMILLNGILPMHQTNEP